MFNLFDEDGNGNISIEELLNMMAFFIEIGMKTNIYLFTNQSDWLSFQYFVFPSFLLNSLVYLFALSPQSPCKMLIIIGMDTGSVDMAKTMAEVFQKGDANKDEKLNKQEFINVSAMFSHKSRSRVIKHSSYKQL